jgi:hypothetical protein
MSFLQFFLRFFLRCLDFDSSNYFFLTFCNVSSILHYSQLIWSNNEKKFWGFKEMRDFNMNFGLLDDFNRFFFNYQLHHWSNILWRNPFLGCLKARDFVGFLALLRLFHIFFRSFSIFLHAPKQGIL